MIAKPRSVKRRMRQRLVMSGEQIFNRVRVIKPRERNYYSRPQPTKKTVAAALFNLLMGKELV